MADKILRRTSYGGEQTENEKGSYNNCSGEPHKVLASCTATQNLFSILL